MFNTLKISSFIVRYDSAIMKLNHDMVQIKWWRNKINSLVQLVQLKLVLYKESCSFWLSPIYRPLIWSPLYPSYMVSGIRNNPTFEAALASVYMSKRSPCRPSQSWPCVIIHNPYWCANISLSLRFPRSFDHSGFCRVNFHFFDTNFCFKSKI